MLRISEYSTLKGKVAFGRGAIGPGEINVELQK
jgi:hypothetical protein